MTMGFAEVAQAAGSIYYVPFHLLSSLFNYAYTSCEYDLHLTCGWYSRKVMRKCVKSQLWFPCQVTRVCVPLAFSLPLQARKYLK
jgi:hypothetical protein